MSRRAFISTGAVLVLAVGAGVGVRNAFEAPDVAHPSSKIGDGTMKTLVVYGTKSGCTTGVAERIGAKMSEQGMIVDVRPAEDAGDPSGYDAVVVGSGVRAGQWHASVKSWLTANADAVRSRPAVFFTCCMTMTQDGKDAEVLAYTDPIIEATGIKPVDIGLFAGWFEPKKFSFAERSILKLMKTPEGDFRDWDAIDAWARKVALQLQA